MPQIASSHVLAARGVARVQQILANSDALSEVIRNDYGEDLIAQTHRGGTADPYHILIQVKSTICLAKGRDGAYRISLSVDHLLRWISQVGNILVCVFDESSNRVFCFSPKSRFSLWDLSVSKSKSKSVKFTDHDELTELNAKSIIWQCRIGYYSDLLAIAENNYQYAVSHGSKRDRKLLHLNIRLICLNFLKMIGFLKGDELSDNIRQQFKNGGPLFSTQLNDDGSCNTRVLLMFIIIGEVNEVTGQGVPANLMENSTELAGHYYMHAHRKEWDEVTAHFCVKWTPYAPLR